MKLKHLSCCIATLSIFCANLFASSKTPICEIPPEGRVIDKPGTYVFTNDIKWEGEEGALTAITITASDVILDMKGHTLSAPRNVPLSGTIGILADEANGLELRKGTITGFQLIGVAISNSYDVTLANVTTSNIGNGVPGYTPTGVHASKCLNLTISKLAVNNVNGSGPDFNGKGNVVSGVYLSECDNVQIDGIISGVNGYSNVVSGVFGILCDGVTMEKLDIADVNGSATAVSGASFGLSANLTFDKSAVTDLHNDAGVCSGIATDDCQHVNVLNTTVSGLSTGLTPNPGAPGHTCIGMVFAPIRVVEGVSEINVTNPGTGYSQILLPSVVIGPPDISNGSQAVGFPIVNADGELESVQILDPGAGYYEAPSVEIVPNLLWPEGTGATATAVATALQEGSASDFLIEKCKISDVTGSCDDAHGISLFVVSDATISKVTVENVSDGRGGRGAKATGIEVYGLIDNAPSDILVENCKVRNISAISPGDLQAAGFSVAGKGVTFSNCEARDVTVSGANPVDATAPGYGIGFAWAPDIRPEYTYAALEVEIENCTARGCQVGFDTFYFQDSTWSGIKSIDNDLNIKQEAAGVVRTLYCDGCSECPDAPQESPEDWFQTVAVKNIAEGNIFE